MNPFATVIAVIALLLAAVPTASAQAPHRPHRTLRTEHFAIHFTPELEPLARRAAVRAERAWGRLSAHLVAPRGMVDLVVADNVDYANGFATVFPSSRIVVFAHPPIESPALRYNDDWLDLVITHELAHVFHLDRSRGMWRGLQYVFGRVPFFFPNAYTPGWLTEGLATYYESLLTGSGRVKGAYHRELALASAREGRLPRLDEISRSTPVFPGGAGVYVYGSLFVDHLARTRGEDKVRALVERTAVHPLPFILNRVSRNAFGVSYAQAWREFTDSLDRTAGSYTAPYPGWRDLTPASHAAEFVRWDADGSLTYTGAAPRERYGAWRIAPDGRRTYLGRRNGPTPNVRLADGSIVYAQPDYVDPYTFRGDLYLERDGRTTRLTRGARISAPDARPDGQVVAVQSIPGGSRLVRFDIATRALTPLTDGGMDEFWAEPAWSPDGSRVAAVRWRFGGVSAIVILDTAGRVIEEHGGSRAVQSSPAWSADGRSVIYTSDLEGRFDVLIADVGEAHPPTRIGGDVGSLFSPRLAPDGRTLAAVRLGARGVHVGVAPIDSSRFEPARVIAAPPPADTIAAFSGASRRYSAARQLLPRFWIPVAYGGDRDTRLGFFTLGNDILDRHSYEAELAVPVQGDGVVGGLSYRYAGLKRPVLGASVSQSWEERGTVYSDTTYTEELAHVDRRTRALALSATFARPRVRSSLAFVVGAGAEWRVNTITPEIATGIDTAFFQDSVIPRATAGLGYSRVVSAPYAISPEDGFTFSVNATNRWVRSRAERPSQAVVGAVTGYKSLPLPGYARHVSALRLAGGWTDDRAVTELEAGGVSGAELPVAFGLGTIGEGRRTFFVRGFEPRTLIGTRAWAASAEYRAPLLLMARGAGLIPVFLERTSVALFGDAASAWCPTYVAGLCREGNPKATIGSAGAELRITMAFGSWDEPFQLRGGVAAPVLEAERARDPVSFYLSSGLAF